MWRGERIATAHLLAIDLERALPQDAFQKEFVATGFGHLHGGGVNRFTDVLMLQR